MRNKQITVLLAEDHKIVREGLRLLLEMEDDIKIVAEAETGHEAIRMLKETDAEVIIMDISMPDLNGLEATRKIKTISPSTKVLVLSAYADDAYVEKAASLGVSGFLIKQCASNLLVNAIREIQKGHTYFSPSVLARMNERDKKRTSRNGYKKEYLQISPRETEVLQLIAEGNANKQIAAKLGISIKTVEKHRQHLMDKLQIHDVAGLTRYAISEGISRNHSHHVK